MSKLAQTTSKYTIYARFDADGTIEKPDVIGAVFGQTEGLLGPDMDLQELQRTGRIGRIEVNVRTTSGKTSGLITIPSSLDSSETVLIAACMETIERVGPCNARIRIERVEDVRAVKRKYAVDRAKELLGKLFEEGLTDVHLITEQIKEAVRSSEVVSYGGLPAGPAIDNYDSLVIVEGRADVINLLRCGIKNVIAIEGTNVPQAIIDLSKEKITTAFTDGDRGGDLIIKELLAVCDIDYIAQAERDKEVEELSKKEIFKALRDKIPSDQIKIEHVEGKQKPVAKAIAIEAEHLEPVETKRFKEILNELTGTRAACFLNEDLEILGKVPIKEMFRAAREIKSTAIALDGDIDQKLINIAAQCGTEWLLGMRVRDNVRVPEGLQIITLKDL